MTTFGGAIGDHMIELTYRCSNPQCRAEDRGRFFPNEAPFPAITCYSCRSGSGQKQGLGEMLQKRLGMYPVMEQVH